LGSDRVPYRERSREAFPPFGVGVVPPLNAIVEIAAQISLVAAGDTNVGFRSISGATALRAVGLS
jgi:hypothetical protein